MAYTLRRRSEKMVRNPLTWTPMLKDAGPARATSEVQRSTIKVQTLNAERGTLKAASKAIGYLTRAEMYGARTSQRRDLGMVAAARRVTL